MRKKINSFIKTTGLAIGIAAVAAISIAYAQRMYPAGETTGTSGVYVNQGQAGLVGTSIPQDATFGAFYTNGITRLWNAQTSQFDAWKTSLSNPAGSTHTGVAAVTTFQGTSSALNIAAATTVKSSAGRLFRVSVVVAGAAGQVCDVNGACAAANVVGTIPAVVGTYEFNWPMLTGIRVEPGAGQTVAIVYQ